MTKLSPIIFFGSEDFSATILQSLLEGGWPVPLVVTRPRRAKGRGRRDTAHPVLDLAKAAGIRVITPQTWESEQLEALRSSGSEAAVLASFGMILPPSVLESFPVGIINVHPSLLPRWRGASPIESAILHGDAETGVTLMKLVQAMDAGPIYAQQTLPLTGQETQNSLRTILAQEGADLLIEELPNIVNGTTKPSPQPAEGVSYAPRLNKNDGIINWTAPARDIERQIRAYEVWPQSRTKLYGHDVIIVAASVQRAPSRPLAAGEPFTAGRQLRVATGKNSLQIEQIKPAGKQVMSGQAFLNGYAPSV